MENGNKTRTWSCDDTAIEPLTLRRVQLSESIEQLGEKRGEEDLLIYLKSDCGTVERKLQCRVPGPAAASPGKPPHGGGKGVSLYHVDNDDGKGDDRVSGLYLPSYSSLSSSQKDSEDEALLKGAGKNENVKGKEAAFLALIPSRAHMSKWMSALPDTVPLSLLSIPGTHNSHTYFRALPSVRCQAVSVASQLRQGIRFLDIRVSVPPVAVPHNPSSFSVNDLGLVHGAFPASLAVVKGEMLKTILEDVYEFLDSDEGQNETVLVSLKREGTGRGNDTDLSFFAEKGFRGERRRDKRMRWWFSGSSGRDGGLPTLGEVRGMCVLVRRFAGGGVGGNRKGMNGWGDVEGGVMGPGRELGLGCSAWPDNCVDGRCDIVVGASTSACLAGGRKPPHLRIQDWYEVGRAGNLGRKIRFAVEHLERAGREIGRYYHCHHGMQGSSFNLHSNNGTADAANTPANTLNAHTHTSTHSHTTIPEILPPALSSLFPAGGTNSCSLSPSSSSTSSTLTKTATSLASITTALTTDSCAPLQATATVPGSCAGTGTCTKATTNAATNAATKLATPTPKARTGTTAKTIKKVVMVPANASTISPHPSRPQPQPPLFINFLTASNFFSPAVWPEKVAARVNPVVERYLCGIHGVGRCGSDGHDSEGGIEEDDRGSGLGILSGTGTGIVVADWVGRDGEWGLVRCVVGMNSGLIGRTK